MGTIIPSDDVDRVDVRLALSRLDLNIVTALDALLTERNVTRAAERLTLSQPALSASLARLRVHFDDPLLVRRGRVHDLTPLGERLAALTGSALNRLYAIFQATSVFDPASAVRDFVIHCSDHSATTVGRKVRTLAGRFAPGVTLRFVHQAAAAQNPPPPEELLAMADGAILPLGVLHSSPHINLLNERWVCIVSENNSRVGDELTLNDLSELPWVTNYHNPHLAIPPVRHLHLLGIRPRVDTVVEGFLALPYFVSDTDRIAFVPEGVADQMPETLGVRKMTPPFATLHHELAFWWHPALDEDPGHAWLRSVFESVGAQP